MRRVEYVERLFEDSRQSPPYIEREVPMRWTACVVALVLSCRLLALGAQSPAFEVATIKPSGAESPPMSLQRQPGGRLVTSNTPLTFLIGWAFSLDDGRLFGLPKGADAAKFDVIAKAPSDNLAAGQTQL